MRLFHALLFDRYVEDIPAAAASDAWSVLLPRAESLKFTVVTDTVSGGGTPMLNVRLYHGNAAMFAPAALPKLKDLLADEVLLTSGTKTYTATYTASDSYPASGYMSLLIELAGGLPPPKAHVRIWACGRGERLLTRPATATSFGIQYQAARMLDEEDKVAGRKRLTKAGSSAAVSPELLYPAAKWEQ